MSILAKKRRQALALLSLLSLWCALIRSATSFNLDLKSPIFKQVGGGNASLYFGFSVAQHLLVKPTRTPYILVGAPHDSTVWNGRRYSLSGAIYRCAVAPSTAVDWNRHGDCEQVPIDFETRRSDEVSGSSWLDDNLKEQFKSRLFENQWLGVSLASTITGSFSTCAHKYVHYYNFTTRDEHATYGACYRFANDFTQEHKHVPCLQHSHEVSTFYFNNYAYCQAGTSLSMVEDQTLLPSSALDTYMSYGMPGALNFRGLVGMRTLGKASGGLSSSSSSSSSASGSAAASTSSSGSSADYMYKNRSSLCKFDIENDRPTYDGFCPSLWEKHSYLGMAHVLVRRYLGRDKMHVLAAGAPREALSGLVRFFTVQFDVSFGQVTRLLPGVLVGAQRGSYFGASMAACDLNGDKSDDLIVGAPYYSRRYDEPNVGAVYVYLNHKQRGFAEPYVLNFTGTRARSLFGHSIACIGDIDKDGFNDFAVGAPFEESDDASDAANRNSRASDDNSNNQSDSNHNQDASHDDDDEQRQRDARATGAVYIYRGAASIGLVRLSQRVHARDLRIAKPRVTKVSRNLNDLIDEEIGGGGGGTSGSNSVRLRGFGYSLSGGLDMDANTYPDLVVGALHSDAVVVLRARPVVHIRAYLANLLTIQDIDQKVKECHRDSTATTAAAAAAAAGSAQTQAADTVCFPLVVCFEVTGAARLDVSQLPLLNYTLVAEPNATAAGSVRVYFNATGTRALTNRALSLGLGSSGRACETSTVLIKKDNSDFLRPIKFALAYSFATATATATESESVEAEAASGADMRLSDIRRRPVVHQDANSYEFEANFKKDCGSDKKCLTDLQLSAQFVGLMVDVDNVPLLSFKESDTVTVAVSLRNGGAPSEPAYSTQIHVMFDERLDFIRKIETEAPSGFTCAINYRLKANYLVCKMTSDVAGVPFDANQTARFELTFSSMRLYRYANITSAPNVLFRVEAKTLSTDVDLSNNLVSILAKLKVRANIYLYGTKTPEQVFFSDSGLIRGESAMEGLEQIGPIIEHTYIINNAGPFSVNSFQLLVDWPYEARLVDFDPVAKPGQRDIDGKHLLYLIEKPTKIPNNHPMSVVCGSYAVDPLRIANNNKAAATATLPTRRRRRSATGDYSHDVIKSPLTEQSSQRTAIIDCFSNTAYCYKINCSFFGDFSKDETISLKFTARLWNATMVEDYAGFERVFIKSHARLLLSDGIHDERPVDNENSVATIVYSSGVTVQAEKTLPIWIYALSVLIGIVLLLICTVGFWMLGFFERKKFGEEKYVLENEKVNKTPY